LAAMPPLPPLPLVELPELKLLKHHQLHLGRYQLKSYKIIFLTQIMIVLAASGPCKVSS
jgi:hypothetical protein